MAAKHLQIGFVAVADCAPLVMAKELGLFARRGLRVQLQRELGWASVRDKVIYGDLQAAHAVVGMPFAATLGIGSPACDCVTGLVLNQHGNAITISNELWKCGVRDGETLRRVITRRGVDHVLTFGMVYPFSSHNFLLRAWLTAAGINPDRDVRIVVVPPPQMVVNLKAGHLDGFCVGEPWNSVALQSGAGHCVAVSSELAKGHPEKVLMTRADFAEKRPEEHRALVASLLEACAFCQQPENHGAVISALARPEYVGVPEKIIAQGIRGKLDLGPAHSATLNDFNVFYSADANDPSTEKAAWVMAQLRRTGSIDEPARLTPALGRRVFRSDIFQTAARLAELPPTKNNHDPSFESKLVTA